MRKHREYLVLTEHSKSAGIVTTDLTATNSKIQGFGGSASSSYGIAVEGNLAAEDSSLTGTGADYISIGSYGVSVDGDVQLTNSELNGQGGSNTGLEAGFGGSFGIALSQDSTVNLTDSTLSGKSNDVFSQQLWNLCAEFRIQSQGYSFLVGSARDAVKSVPSVYLLAILQQVIIPLYLRLRIGRCGRKHRIASSY